MHQTNNRSVEGAHGKARGGRFFTGDLPTRLAALRIVICVALIAGIMLSLNLWFPATRSFPRVPVITFLPQTVVPTVEYLLSGLLVITLAAVIFAKTTGRYLSIAIGLLILLVLLDQMRLQPWVFQYLFTIHRNRSAKSAREG